MFLAFALLQTSRPDHLLDARKASANPQFASSQPHVVPADVDRFQRVVFGLLNTEAICRLPDFVGVIVVNDRTGCERQVIRTWQQIAIESCQVSAESRYRDTLPRTY